MAIKNKLAKINTTSENLTKIKVSFDFFSWSLTSQTGNLGCACAHIFQKVYGQLVLLPTRTESTHTFSLVNSYFFATRTLVNSYFFFGQPVLFFGQLVLFLWSTRTF